MWFRTTLALLLVASVFAEPADVESSREEVPEGPVEDGSNTPDQPVKFGIVYLVNVLRGSPREIAPPGEGEENNIEAGDFQKHPETGLLIIRPIAIITARANLGPVENGDQEQSSPDRLPGPVENINQEKPLPERLQV